MYLTLEEGNMQCLQCGKEFIPKMKKQVFCSAKCRDNKHNGNRKRILELWIKLDPEMQDKVIRFIEWEMARK